MVALKIDEDRTMTENKNELYNKRLFLNEIDVEADSEEDAKEKFKKYITSLLEDDKSIGIFRSSGHDFLSVLIK